LTRVPDVVEAAAPGAATLLFGHLGDGNVHVSAIGPDPDDEAPRRGRPAPRGRVRGDDQRRAGVGVAKARRPDLVCSEGELALMRPRARDRPGGILNPGVVLPAAGQD
jgi:hypothetical protein